MTKHIFIAIMILLTFNYAKAQDTTTTASGLKYIILEEGSGVKAENNKTVEVHYTGYLLDGKVFDSSIERNEPIEFILGTRQVIPGWDEGIALMSVGDKYRLIIPADLAYGSQGAGNVIPPDATLIFDTELMSVGEPKESISDILLQTIINKDVESAILQYRDLKLNNEEKYNFKESQLNALGYNLVKLGKNAEAIEILKLNIEEFPASANVYDSMGEVYMISGNNELALENYKKSLQIDPANMNALEMIQKLEK